MCNLLQLFSLIQKCDAGKIGKSGFARWGIDLTAAGRDGHYFERRRSQRSLTRKRRKNFLRLRVRLR
jgi:hypothetical protein